MNFIMSLLSVAIAAGVGYTTAIYRKEIRHFVKKNILKKGTLNKVPKTTNEYAEEGIEQSSNVSLKNNATSSDKHISNPTKESYNLDAAKHQLLESIEKFYGCFEYIYQSSINPENSSQDYSDFETRINALKNCPDLQHYWKMSKNDLPKFIKFLFDSGIQRDKSMHIVADESTAYKYYKLDGSEVVKNETYTIISPCWSWENKILGKGIIE